LRIYCVGEELLASQEELSFVELVIIPAVSVLKTSTKKKACIISDVDVVTAANICSHSLLFCGYIETSGAGVEDSSES
jgi:hypothetical protein